LNFLDNEEDDRSSSDEGKGGEGRGGRSLHLLGPEDESCTFSIRDEGDLLVLKKQKDHERQFEIGTADKAPLLMGEGESVFDPKDIVCDDNRFLGRGAAGTVVKAIHAPTKTPLAVKIIKVLGHDHGRRRQLRADLGLFKNTAADCAFIVRCYAAYWEKASQSIHLVLEMMDAGSLHDLRISAEDKKMPEPELAIALFQILEGLKFLHIRKIVHRDIKPHNVLLNSEGAVKLADFGVAKLETNTAGYCDTFTGTQLYMSPERIVGEDYGTGADIWSLGLMVYELAAGKHPFPPISSVPVLFDILIHRPEPRLDPNEGFSPELCDFVAKCLVRDPSKRASAVQLQAHPFLIREAPPMASQVDFARWIRQQMQRASSAKAPPR